MPGKTSQSSTRGKQESKEHLSFAQNTEAQEKKISIWPEWTEAELAAEKWDLGGGKGKDKGRVTLYKDPEEVLLPSILLPEEGLCWKRPTDVSVMPDGAPVIVEDPECTEIDLISANTHLLHCELLAWVISQLKLLWSLRFRLSSSEAGWRPWEHIHPHPKGAPAPQFNPAGKYCVKLFWMGAWRKVTVDDLLPYVEHPAEGKGREQYCSLLPHTSHPQEFWPAILTKAILKIAALDYDGGGDLSEFGDCSVVHLLTGWAPLIIPMRLDSEQMWEELQHSLPLWVREGEDQDQNQPGSDTIVMASFASAHQLCASYPPPSLKLEISTSRDLLQNVGLHTPHSCPSHPFLLTQVRDEPLVAPLKEPPPPTLQAPYYLGLKHRRRGPGDPSPPPSPTPAELRFVEIVTPFAVTEPDQPQGSPSFQPQEERPTETEVQSNEDKSMKSGGRTWMQFADFVRAFRFLHVFRNPASFAHRETYSDLSLTVENSAQSGATATKKSTSSLQLSSASKPGASREPNILFVDSVRAVQLHLVFSSLSNWRETRQSLQFIPTFAFEPESVCQETEEVVSGVLVVEPYSWRSLQTSLSALSVTTSGTRGAMLSLPPGRHIFKLHADTPLGHHLEVLSSSPFTLTDEDNIFTLLSKESARFLAHCSRVVETLLTASKFCGEGAGSRGAGLERRVRSLVGIHVGKEVTANHVRMMLATALHVWYTLGPSYGLTPAMLFAWRAFLHTLLSMMEQRLPQDGTPVDLNSAWRILATTKDGGETSVPDSWTDREASAEEEHSARVIQRCFRHHLRARMQRAMAPGTEEHTQEAISQSVSLLQPHIEELGRALFSGMFKLQPSLLERFPFYKDEWSRAFSKVYSGSFPPLQSHSWTVVLREEFQVPEPQLLVPQFHCPLSSNLLRVVNNDTGRELPRIFHTTVPAAVEPNERGYTFIGEVWTRGEGVEGGRWVLRVVGSSPDLPMWRGGEGEEVGTTFHTHETQEYCLPDREGRLFRIVLKTSQECPISVQLSTSKRDAYFKLELLDRESAVACVQGRGHGVIPLFSLASCQPDSTREEGGPEESQGHKYILQATVLHNSWPVSDSAWPYISMIKSMEKLDELGSVRPGSEKPPSGKKSKGKEKGGKKGATPQPSNSKIDTGKPHWTLRIVTTTSDRESLEVRKDTEKADELRSMVQAWETEQPGRCKKAQESRQKFLEARALKDASSVSEEDQSIAMSAFSEGSSSVPQPPTGPVPIRQMDLSPFTIKGKGPPRLLDASEEAWRQQERQRVFREYRSQRQVVLRLRERDRELRNETKKEQVELAEQWQVELDELRNKMNTGREAIRSRHMVKEKARMEAELAAQKPQEEQLAAGRESKSKGKAKGKKK